MKEIREKLAKSEEKHRRATAHCARIAGDVVVALREADFWRNLVFEALEAYKQGPK